MTIKLATTVIMAPRGPQFLFQFDSRFGRIADNGAYAGLFPGDFKGIEAICPLDDIGCL